MKKITLLLLLLCSLTGFSQSTETQADNNIYNTAGIDTKPEFPGGIEKLNAMVNESYLKSGYASEKKGKVYAMFVIEKDGSLTDVKILRQVDILKAKELVRILTTLPVKWTPGKQNGKTVRVLYSLPLIIGT
ncbi:energy transducer TonB [Flavobacterium phycosphaerae]|uniref:energy transducer TonB n=1 Tax=Flavobacterium phycosphaerae TaxID=2697515 RepID=UPI00138B042B|nr:energy transducer TonB [Flavobacterium phycosphaerae]